jgi:hypothetical protein
MTLLVLLGESRSGRHRTGAHGRPVRARVSLVVMPPRRIPKWRQLLLGLLGFPGDGDIPKQGWMRGAMIAVYGAVAVVVVLIVVAVLFG